jgi:hypothetical protein
MPLIFECRNKKNVITILISPGKTIIKTFAANHRLFNQGLLVSVIPGSGAKVLKVKAVSRIEGED